MDWNALGCRWLETATALNDFLIESLESAERQLQRDTSDRLGATEKTCASDYIGSALLRHVPTAMESPRRRGGKPLVVVPDFAVVRPKHADRQHRARNVKTKRHSRWLRNDPHLDGLPPLPYLDLTYGLDPIARELSHPALVQRDGTGAAVAVHHIPWRDADGGSEEALLLPIAPAPTPLITLTPDAAAELDRRRRDTNIR